MEHLLLLHGALASAAQFQPFSPLLKNDFDAEAIHFSGHGGSAIPPGGYTFDVFASDILHYADAHKIDKLNLFGFSMGGFAALYFAKLYPERVRKIMTLNTKFLWDEQGTAKETAMLETEKMQQKVPAFADQLKQQHGNDHWEQVVAATATMMNSLSKKNVLTDQDFKNIHIPVLLAVGDRDKTSGIEENVAVFRTLTNAQLLVLPNTPHPFDRVNQNGLAEDLKRFFIH